MGNEKYSNFQTCKVQIEERGLTEELVMMIVDSPDQIIQEDEEKIII